MTCKDCIHEKVCDALIKKGCPWLEGKYSADKFCMYFKNKEDVVEVVRCLECVHCDPENRHCDHPMGTTLPIGRKETDFCSYGKKVE